MIERSIQQIQKMLNAKLYNCLDQSQKIYGVCIDSRQVGASSLYVPMIGARADGHDFIEQVKSAGCGCALWQEDHKPYPQGIALVLVDDTTKALQNLAKAYLEQVSPYIIAITGSNGKTSSKDMLASIFQQEKRTYKTQGNRNNEIGLPLTILEMDEDCQVCILEMGMENFGEIAFLCSIAKPDAAMITTIGSAHMENLGSKEGIAKAKLEIYENLKSGGFFVYDKESPEIEKMINYRDDVHSQSFGCNGDVTLVSPIKTYDSGISFCTSSFDEPVELHTIGAFQAKNAMACIAVAMHYGISKESILQGLKTCQFTGMRMHLQKIGEAKVLDDSYKSNPESAKAAIDGLMDVQAKLHIACLSDMLDLGKDEIALHEDVGSYCKEKGVDLLFTYGPLSQHMIEHHPRAKWFSSKEEMAVEVKKYLDQDCAILIKGSRAMQMDVLVASLKGE